MKLIDLLNRMYRTVTVTITSGTVDCDYKVYVSCKKIERIPKDLINLIGNREVKDIYTLYDVIKITIE